MELNYVSLNVNHIHADWCGGTLYLSLSGDADSVRIFLKPDTDAARAILTAIHSAVELPSIVRPLDDIGAEAAEYMDAAEKGPKRIECGMPFETKGGEWVVWYGDTDGTAYACKYCDDNSTVFYLPSGQFEGNNDPNFHMHAKFYNPTALCNECGIYHG